MEKYSIELCIKNMGHIQNVQDALAQEEISLARIRKDNDIETVLAYIEMWIIDLNIFINVKTKMTTPQIQETARYIYEEYYYFRIHELKLVFCDIKKGRYGEMYNRLDGLFILNCFGQYAQLR